MGLFERRVGVQTPKGKGTQAERLYHLWKVSSPTDQLRIERSLTNICARACAGLCPPVERSSTFYGRDPFPADMARRFGKRWPFCSEFVKAELRVGPVDDCRYLGRRCRQRLIDEIRKVGRQNQRDYLREVERDSRGRFLPA
jgi:hypothetical protein